MKMLFLATERKLSIKTVALPHFYTFGDERRQICVAYKLMPFHSNQMLVIVEIATVMCAMHETLLV